MTGNSHTLLYEPKSFVYQAICPGLSTTLYFPTGDLPICHRLIPSTGFVTPYFHLFWCNSLPAQIILYIRECTFFSLLQPLFKCIPKYYSCIAQFSWANFRRKFQFILFNSQNFNCTIRLCGKRGKKYMC